MPQMPAFTDDAKSDIDELHQLVRTLSNYSFIHHSEKEDFFDTLRPLLRNLGVYTMPQPQRNITHRNALHIAVSLLINCRASWRDELVSEVTSVVNETEEEEELVVTVRTYVEPVVPTYIVTAEVDDEVVVVCQNRGTVVSDGDIDTIAQLAVDKEFNNLTLTRNETQSIILKSNVLSVRQRQDAPTARKTIEWCLQRIE